MKLHVYNQVPNFGDQLNYLIFPKLLKDFLDDDVKTIVLGIGTLIKPRARRGCHEIILGAGTGYSRGRYSLINRSIYTVRGPLTAKIMGLNDDFAAIDPGILTASIYSPNRDLPQGARAAFMPHWQTDQAAGEQWREASRIAEIDYISPLSDALTILTQLQSCSLLISEALHGAVIAESYSKPWIPVILGPNILDFKWRDWCQSIAIDYRPCVELPKLYDSENPITWIHHCKRILGEMGIGKSKYSYIPKRRTSQCDIAAAALKLRRIVADAEHLKHQGVRTAVSLATERLLKAIDAFRRDVSSGRFSIFKR